jgi:hypothetical protein
MATKNTNKLSYSWPLVLVAAFILRMLIASLGYNYDIESFEIVADIVLNGDTVYAATTRYNYGPIWAYLLAALRQMQLWTGAQGIENFHLWVAGFLSLIDLATAELLRKNIGRTSALFLLFNPVSLALTGYHSQMEMLAIFWAWLGWLYLKKDPQKNLIPAAIFMGISLIQKHIFLFFPIWLLFDKNLKLKQRIFISMMIYSIFILGFLPFLWEAESRNGIILNVFGYNSAEGASLIPLIFRFVFGKENLELFLASIPVLKGYKFIFILLICIAGIVSVKKRTEDYFYLYLLLFLGLSSAFANQYLAIPLLSLAICYKKPESWLYIFFAGGFLWLRAPHAPPDSLDCLNSIYEYGGLLTLKRAIFSAYSAQAILIILWIRIILSQKNNYSSL